MTGLLVVAATMFFVLGMAFAITLARVGARADAALDEARRGEGGRTVAREDVGS